MQIKTDLGTLRESAREIRAEQVGTLTGTTVQQDLQQLVQQSTTDVPSSTGLTYGRLSTAAGPPNSWVALPATTSYPTQAAAAAATIPAGTMFVQTAGYATVGDAGQALYCQTTGATTGGFQSADGQWWELAPGQRIIPQMFGASGNATVDDGPALRAAISYCQSNNRDLWLTTLHMCGQDGSNPWCVHLTSHIRIRGEGVSAGIQPATAIGSATVDTIYIQPAGASDLTMIENVYLGSPVTGTRAGRYGIYIDTTGTSSNIGELIIERCYILKGQAGTGPFIGAAIYHANNPTNNPSGGLYLARIRDNRVLGGGISLNQSGDSITIQGNIITGTNSGIYAALVSGAGQLMIAQNNISAAFASITVDSGTRVTIRDNELEPVASAYSGPIVWIKGSVAQVYDIEVSGNEFTAVPSTTITTALQLSNTTAGIVRDNVFSFAYVPSISCINIASCTNLRIDRNRYTAGVPTVVTDGLSQTMGIVFQIGASNAPAFSNGWTNFGSGTQPAQFYKDINGRVFVDFVLAGGTSASAAFTLPVGYRPANTALFAVYGPTGNAAEIQVTAAGAVIPISTTVTQIGGAVSFLAVDQGNYIG